MLLEYSEVLEPPSIVAQHLLQLRTLPLRYIFFETELWAHCQLRSYTTDVRDNNPPEQIAMLSDTLCHWWLVILLRDGHPPTVPFLTFPRACRGVVLCEGSRCCRRCSVDCSRCASSIPLCSYVSVPDQWRYSFRAMKRGHFRVSIVDATTCAYLPSCLAHRRPSPGLRGALRARGWRIVDVRVIRRKFLKLLGNRVEFRDEFWREIFS